MALIPAHACDSGVLYRDPARGLVLVPTERERTAPSVQVFGRQQTRGFERARDRVVKAGCLTG